MTPRLSAGFLALLLACHLAAGGCAPGQRAAPTADGALARETVRGMPKRPITAAEAVDVWSLVDSENATFDVRLSDGGKAISNWSKGPNGARGESGRWTIEDGEIVIEYDDGWCDRIIGRADGSYGKISFAPGAPRDGQATNFGRAVRTEPAFAKWVGVYQLPRAESRLGEPFYVSIQSTHAAWKSIDALRVGSWWVSGSGWLRIRWANGWFDEFRPVFTGYEVRSWKPGTELDEKGDPQGPPTNLGKARRLVQ
jgi:hypothetical protein